MAGTELLLPRADGTVQTYRPGPRQPWPTLGQPLRARTAYAAVHVVADPLADTGPGGPARLDWDGTLAYRHYLWSLGLAVAEAMDTAQRGMGLDWPAAQELIRRSAREAQATGGTIAAGAGTDHLPPRPGRTVDDVIAAYEEQCAYVEAQGARVILMASRALAAIARGPEDYARVYGRILTQVSRPVILHWLGDMFDPQLAGYWGARDLDAATASCLGIMADHATKIEGIKISLLDAAREVDMRRRLPPGVRMYTGDDFNYPELIAGDERGYSHALLGIFDAIAPAAAAALRCLDAGDRARYDEILAPTVPLSRHIFQTPTFHYKTGVVFMAYLNGHQSHFRMVGGQESARSVMHLAELFVLADRAGLLRDPELAVSRMKRFLALAGVTCGNSRRAWYDGHPRSDGRGWSACPVGLTTARVRGACAWSSRTPACGSTMPLRSLCATAHRRCSRWAIRRTRSLSRNAPPCASMTAAVRCAYCVPSRTAAPSFWSDWGAR